MDPGIPEMTGRDMETIRKYVFTTLCILSISCLCMGIHAKSASAVPGKVTGVGYKIAPFKTKRVDKKAGSKAYKSGAAYYWSKTYYK